MFYIHEINCISPQETFDGAGIDDLYPPVNNKMNVIEPVYEAIPRNSLRRMGKTVRIGIGAALPILKKTKEISGIVIGTGNGGMEDSIIFLNQIIEYDEGLLTPAHFVQSTANAMASQLSLASLNRGYNITHVHRGLSFEMAALDAAMLLKENAGNTYLLGGVDEISAYNYKLDYLAGWYKNEATSAAELYNTGTAGTIAGEGAVMMLVNNEPYNAKARVVSISTLHTSDQTAAREHLQQFLAAKPGFDIDLLLSGEDGDVRFLTYYANAENLLKHSSVARFKHMCGAYPTSSSFALWLACQLIAGVPMPSHMMKEDRLKKSYNNILIYNCHKGVQHSIILVSKDK